MPCHAGRDDGQICHSGRPGHLEEGHEGPEGAQQAVVTFARALALNDAEFSRRLGVSRGTLSNWHNGKVGRLRISPEQARLYMTECDFRAAQLREAAQAFAKLGR